MKNVKQDFEILDEIDGDKILKKIETCGRVCWQSEWAKCDGSAERFVKMIIGYGHESVLEHVSITVKVVTDRGISHEIVRHRIGSYSQESTRYCNYTKDKFNGEIKVVMTPCLELDDVVNKYITWGEELYDYLIKTRGVPPEFARDILPTCLKTELVITYNLRQWRHFFKMRTDEHAHPKIRKLATDILVEFKKRIPVVFDDIKTIYDE